MKKNTLKRLTACALAGTMAFSMTSCMGGGQNGGNGNNQSGNKNQSGKLFDSPTEISMVIGSHTSWPYQENWPVFKYFQEATGATFKIQAIPGTEFLTKLNLMMASPDTLPDLVHSINKESVDIHALTGAFVSVSDNLDKMPNYVKFMDSLPEAEKKELEAQRTAGDGKIYFPPVYGTQKVMNLRTWIYRKDIFEKNNLKVPETLDDMYNVSKQLKAIYPKAYPLCFRNGLDNINIMGPMWKNNFTWSIYYDYKDQKWKLGAAEDTMKDVIQFFHKMYDEKLVPPDFLTINTKSWEELVSTDRGFMMPEYLVRIDYFNIPNRKKNPDYTWAVMNPPKANTPDGQSKITKTNMDPTGFVICNTGKKAQMNNAMKLVDWMYSDEGTQLLSWGKEGESYRVVDGHKEFIIGPDETVQNKYGFGTYGVYQRTESFEATYTKEQSEQGAIAYKNTEDNVNPIDWVPLNEEENRVKNELRDSIVAYAEENISKFMLKQKPMSEWDAFQKGLKDMGLDRLLNVYAGAYNRIMGK